MERWRIGVGELGELFDLDFASDGKLVHSVQAGAHHLCGGFVSCRQVSKTHYALHCGACGLRILLPVEIQGKEEIIDFFCRRGFHKKGEELEVCLECEGRGWHRAERFVTKESFKNGYPEPPKTSLIEETVGCQNCKETGILREKAVV
jgi:hypothetical protein